MRWSVKVTVAVAALVALAGCDFDRELRECAEAERCLIAGPAPVLRFPHNGAGLGSPGASRGGTANPQRPFLVWETESDSRWRYRIQLNKCDPGSSLAGCPFTASASGAEPRPNAYAGSYAVEEDLEIGKRYWWRVRACDSALPGTPCTAWSAPRYFDVGRPEAIPNDLDGNDVADLVVAEARAINAGASEKLRLYKWDGARLNLAGDIPVGPTATFTGNYKVVLAGAGDLNGDGYSDLAVSYSSTDVASAQFPPVDVFLGGPAIPGSPAVTLAPREPDFGARLGRGGDLNGDGYSDLVVCQPGRSQALVFFGGAAGVVDSVGGDVQLTLSAGTSAPSCAFAPFLDMDADGYDDIAVGGAGTVRVFQGRDSTGAWSGVELPVPAGASRFGESLAGGDFNADGHGDVVVAGGDGRAYLYLGSPQWWTTGFPDPIVFDIPPGPIAPAGDVDNDGYADLAVGGGQNGQVQLFRGQATGAPAASALLGFGLANFGIAFAGVGDVNEDSYEDVAVGSTEGLVIFQGAPSASDLGVTTEPLSSPIGSEQFGTDVAGGYGY